uniref:Uncharacterized protein n=1 Tax=Anopheles epiroticus TaxID=199890 RepID=A0A182NZM6_9DIPT
RFNVVPNKQRFTPEDVVKRLPLGLIIDLTNTSRYYDPHDFTSNGIDHVKINVPGKQIPPQRTVDRFIEIVKGYLANPDDRGKLIGVHCTHGLNRTGYLICAYMILELGYQPSDAIRLFNAKRGHHMERGNYLQSLHQMGKEDSSRQGMEPPARDGGSTRQRMEPPPSRNGVYGRERMEPASRDGGYSRQRIEPPSRNCGYGRERMEPPSRDGEYGRQRMEPPARDGYRRQEMESGGYHRRQRMDSPGHHHRHRSPHRPEWRDSQERWNPS